jgi:hypothetical protein
MGLATIFRHRHSDTERANGSRAADSPIVDTGAARLGALVLEFIAIILEEIGRQREEATDRARVDAALARTRRQAGSYDTATVETEEEIKKPEGSK